MSAAARWCFSAVADASRVAMLMRLISFSQSRAAVSTSSRVRPVARASRNASWAASFAARTERGSAVAAAASALLRRSS